MKCKGRFFESCGHDGNLLELYAKQSTAPIGQCIDKFGRFTEVLQAYAKFLQDFELDRDEWQFFRN
ncbi:MAG: hypothetical protein EBT59_07665 [Betaproteobacteria bacterium]|nr:hypothetical protein [Betaproteobacteria bacterium]